MLAGYLSWLCWTYKQTGLVNMLSERNSFVCRGLIILGRKQPLSIATGERRQCQTPEPGIPVTQNLSRTCDRAPTSERCGFEMRKERHLKHVEEGTVWNHLPDGTLGSQFSSAKAEAAPDFRDSVSSGKSESWSTKSLKCSFTDLQLGIMWKQNSTEFS